MRGLCEIFLQLTQQVLAPITPLPRNVFLEELVEPKTVLWQI